jgi:hypothetical protein
VTSAASTAHEPRRDWVWFLVWAAVGCAAGFASISFIWLFFAPLALAVVALLIWRRALSRSAIGFVSGLGVTSLIVAYLNRKGPGTVSWHTATASGSDTYLDPRPWLVAGVVLVAAGVVAFALLARRAQDGDEQRPSGGET